MKYDTLVLYNEYGETVFSSNDCKEIAKFLDRSLNNVYSTIFRVRNGVIKHIYSGDGTKYAAAVITNYPKDLQLIIDSAIEIIYNRGTFDLNDKYGQVFCDLLKTLEGDVQLEGDSE